MYNVKNYFYMCVWKYENINKSVQNTLIDNDVMITINLNHAQLTKWNFVNMKLKMNTNVIIII